MVFACTPLIQNCALFQLHVQCFFLQFIVRVQCTTVVFDSEQPFDQSRQTGSDLIRKSEEATLFSESVKKVIVTFGLNCPL